MLDGRNGKLQQLRESRSAGPLPGGAQQHFAGFPVHLPRLALPGKQGLQPLTYLAGDLLKDRNSRFFSSGVQALSDCQGPILTDLLIHRDQFSAQLLKTMVLIDFSLRLTPRRWGRKTIQRQFSRRRSASIESGDRVPDRWAWRSDN